VITGTVVVLPYVADVILIFVTSVFATPKAALACMKAASILSELTATFPVDASSRIPIFTEDVGATVNITFEPLT